MMAALEELGPRESWRIVQAAMDNLEDESALDDAPREVRDFFEDLKTPPAWVDEASLIPGMRMFHRNSRIILGAFVGGTLVEGFATNISKSFLRLAGCVSKESGASSKTTATCSKCSFRVAWIGAATAGSSRFEFAWCTPRFGACSLTQAIGTSMNWANP